tara:strand:- start:584 stop:2242 length:1659 start_codon:yes stop_codon:yes gene_type:complete
MLNRLYINNYALIDELSIDLKPNFTSITGATGAGKSILISALGLILGERFEMKAIANIDKKCIVEGEFTITNYNLETFFVENDLDYINPTFIRREITPSGRTRSFVNDTPVSLNLLKILGSLLIDIHSQHQTLLLNSKDYQLKLVDTYCNHFDLELKFKSEFKSYIDKKNKLEELVENEKQISREFDYKKFLFDELEEANITFEDKLIEEELNKLENFEEIQQKLNHILKISDTNDLSVTSLLSNIVITLDSIRKNDSNIEALSSRLNSIWIEFKDCISDLENLSSKYNIDFSSRDLLLLQERNNLISKLLQKHNVNNVEELLEIHSNLSKDLENYFNVDNSIELLKKECENAYKSASGIANKITKNRLNVLPKIENELNSLLSNLGMPNARVKILTNSFEKLNIKGYENFIFSFSSNKGVKPMEISKIASGGELSRLMLCFKYILASKTNLPTVIFDEIDSGVSGEIAHKMADLMNRMSNSMQVISITHLPQVAAKGSVHLLVSKIESSNKEKTIIKELTSDERIHELAKMLSGKSITDSSLSNAKDLLNA